MREVVAWDVGAAITPGEPVLLEASAGTGKTWQIASLFARLVVEYGIGVDRILTMTFTKAATAELRDRVRRRLEETRTVLEAETLIETAQHDPVLAGLWHAESGERAQRLLRVEAAIGAFDSAAILTIHGFSQRMLDLFAFESGQESGLSLVESASEALEEIVDDTLAWSHVALSADASALLGGLGWRRVELLQVGRAVTAAVAPQVLPAVPATLVACEAIRDRLKVLEGWLDEGLDATRHMATWWATDGETHLAQLFERRKATKLKSVQEGWFKSNFEKIGRWLSRRPLTEKLDEDSYKWFDEAKLEEKYGALDLSGESFYPLMTRLAEFLDFRTKWRRRLRPLAVFAHGLRDQLDRALARRRQLTFDSMLSVLAAAIENEGPHGPLAGRIRERFDVALVDEFQDTDAAQWAVLERVFARSQARRLVLIGDPKQAIYAFRGADVFVYLSAAKAARHLRTMTTNWRSDGPYVDAMNTLWRAGSNSFDMPAHDGRAGIDYVRVQARENDARVMGLPDVIAHDGAARARRAFEVRWFDGLTLGEDTRTMTNKGRAKKLIATQVAREALALVGSGRITSTGAAIAPGDIAVLVPTHQEAALVQRALRAVGLPAVVGSTASVFGSDAAQWLRTWLLAVAGGGRDRMARVLATTPMFGWTAQDLAAALAQADRGESGPWETWCESIAFWARDFGQGFFRVFEASLDTHGVWPRLLGLADGERHATDLRHLAELAHREAQTHEWGPDAIAKWLAEEAPADAGKAESDEDRSQRLESDAKAVQISTIHASKGLEYPIVLIPYAWVTRDESLADPFLWHDDAHPTQPILELRDEADPERAVAVDKKKAELFQEQMRLLYVTLTRARHHAVVWFGQAGKVSKADAGGEGDGDAPEDALASSALGRLLLRDRPAPALAMGDDDDAAMEQLACVLDALCAGSGDTPTIGWGVDVVAPETPWSPGPGTPSEARSWRGRAVLESSRTVVSFTRIAQRSEVEDEEPERFPMPEIISGQAATEVTEGGVDVEPEPALGATDIEGGPSHLEGLWGGKAVGVWVHSVLEGLDYGTLRGHDGEALRDLIASIATRSGIEAPDDQLALLTDALPRIVSTPLGGDTGVARLPDGFALAGIAARDRLDELRFDLRIDGGPEVATLPERVRAALALRHDESWLGAGWLERVTEPTGEPLLPARSGVLVGAIDLVFRVHDEGGDRYFISDFKTNRILSRAAPRGSRRGHYTPHWMAWEMARHAYHLQALIYTVALHRHLSLRVPGYDYDTHVGGHLYLFLRGMEGDATPEVGGTRLGVFRDRWPRDVVLALDAALGGAT